MVIDLVKSGGAAVPAPRRRWLTRVLLPAAMLVMVLALVGYAARDALLPAKAVSVVRVIAKPVDVKAVASGDDDRTLGAVTVQAPGWLEPDPFPIYVSALTDGVVEDVLVLEGESVDAGQVVARMVDDDARLEAQRATAELARRRAETKTAEAAVAAAKTDWENPVERDRAVAVASAKLTEHKADRLRLDSVIAEHRSRVGELKQQYDRIVNLLPDATSELEVEQARLRVEAQKAALAAAQQQSKVIDAKVEAQAAEFAAARRNRELRVTERLALDLALAKTEEAAAAAREAEAMLAEAKLRLERMEVKSPAAGVVMDRVASPGDKVIFGSDTKHSAHIVHLYQPKKLQVRVDVPLADAAKVGLGQPATVIVDVLPDREFRGELTRMVHKASIEKNTVEVKVAIHDPDPQLKPDMLARVKFRAVTKTTDTSAVATRQQLRVFAPEDLLVDTGDGHTAWVIESEGTIARRRLVTLGAHREDSWVEVADGLRPGDTLIVETDGLSDGDRVRIREELQR